MKILNKCMLIILFVNISKKKYINILKIKYKYDLNV